jgi:hypothetical protein
MAQLFHPSMNTVAKATIFGAVFALLGLGYIGWMIDRSPYITDQGIVKEQPVPFSHEHHVNGLGLDCRYCHTGVETSGYAGVPATKICMTCHSQIWTNAQMLQPVRDSWSMNVPLHWTRVHDLPDYVYFNHSIHISKGIGCVTCHGRVDQMPMTIQASSLQMEWCIGCHRTPEKYIRPRDQVFNMSHKPPPDQKALGERLVKEYGVRKEQLTNCWICHR